MEDRGGKNTMKNPEVVELEVNIKNLEYEIKSLKDEVEASKLRETTLEKENKYIISERDMAMQRNEDLENMLKQLKLERDLQEVLDLPIGDFKQMIHLKDVGRDISSKESDTTLCMKKFILDDEKMQPHYDQTSNTDTFGKYKEKCDEIQTSEKTSSQKSHNGSHDDEPVYDETPQTISSIINKNAKLDSKQCNEEMVEDENSGEVDINKLIKENNILDAESGKKKTLVGSRIGVSNVQSPLTITAVEKVENDMGNKQREERNRKFLERFCSPYVDREVSLTEKITRLEENIVNYMFSAYASEWDILFKISGVSEIPMVVFESLRPGHYIHINIIHAWAHIL
ncbi:hypothetical protein L1987_74431 [Smallanthus sonchifolius]|uniref:Uncharacterized protein n=1 Tax=Smallanthus sonchifolius TaxID=185202 RepID=A0ACB9A727_9ASTR|nr:hypothetical protein L1987_74431 [Smallanthus sonchifolius]